MDKKKKGVEADQYLDRLENFFKKPGQILTGKSRHSQPMQPQEHEWRAPEPANTPVAPAKPKPIPAEQPPVTRQTVPTPPPAPAKQTAPAPQPVAAPSPIENKSIPRTSNRVLTPVSGATNFREGAIVFWSDGTTGIYKESQLDKGYDLVYVLGSDGTVRPKGIVLNAYLPREIGMLPVPLLQEIANTLQWKRENLTFHIANFEDCELIPQINRPKAPPQPTPLPNFDPRRKDDPETQKEMALMNLVRGMRFEIQFGDRKWEAVYWNEDAQGAVIAHKTHGDWALMHLDLKRFKESMVFKGRLNPAQRQELENSIMRGGN